MKHGVARCPEPMPVQLPWSRSRQKAKVKPILAESTAVMASYCYIIHWYSLPFITVPVSLERSCNSIFPGHICVMFCHGFPHIYPACHLWPKALPAHGSQSETASRNRSQKMSQDVTRCQKALITSCDVNVWTYEQLMNVCQTWPCHSMPKESNNALEKVFAVFFAAFAFAAKTAFVAIIMFDCDRWWAWCVSLSLAGADQSLLEPWRWAIRGLWYRCCIGFWSWYCM